MLVYAGMYWYVLVCTSMYCCIGISWYMLVCTRVYTCIYQHVQCFQTLNCLFVDTTRYKVVQWSTPKSYWYMLLHAGVYQYILVYTDIYHHVLCFETLKFLWNPLVDTSRYKAVHCSMGTVPKCPVPLSETVQDGTRQYEVLVLPCTVSFRGTGLFPTSIYCLVPWCIH